MNVRPNSLMRTRRGVGGVKLFNVPGVIYPESLLVAKPGMNPKTGSPYQLPPPNTVDSVQAGSWFGIKASSARILLHRNKVRFYIVQKNGCSRTLYWSRAQVLRLLKKFPQETLTKPRGMLTLRQAMGRLPCTRSTLQRHTVSGRVRVLPRRIKTTSGMRIVYFYHAGDIKKLGEYLQFCARQRRELSAHGRK